MVKFFTSPLLSNIPNVRHGFFTRQGGVSQGPYASLNLSFKDQDPKENVIHNMKLVSQALNIDQMPLFLNQTHSSIVHQIDEYKSIEQPGDACVTNKKNIPIGVLTADCVPILFLDPIHHVIGAAHAGWKGLSLGIIQNTIKKMNALGAKNESLIASIGPCISEESFEVGNDVKLLFPFAQKHFTERKNGKYNFNILETAKLILKNEGIDNIYGLSYNTYAHPEMFFSYRFSKHQSLGGYGCQGSVICLI